MGNAHPLLPVSAIIGQAEVLLALKLLAVQPAIGGLLLEGEKGTAKSTVIRSAAALLFDGPMRTIPLNATEDRLVGGVDMGQALATGVIRPSGGLLSEADQGLVYVDEVNLLADHLVDVLLDAAVSGVIRVHRDGVDAVAKSSFVLVGSMNPEEGSLRPQLLDRFGLHVQVSQLTDISQRVAVMEGQRAFDRDPAAVIARHQGADAALRAQVDAARALLPMVRVPATMHRFVANLCLNARVAGHRADIVLTMAAMAHAALDGRWRVSDEDCIAVAELVLAHRRRDPTPEGLSHANSPIDDHPVRGDAAGGGDAGEQADSGVHEADQTEGQTDGQVGDRADTLGGGQADSRADSQGREADASAGEDGRPVPSAPFTRDDEGDAVREEGGQTEIDDQGTGPSPAQGDQVPSGIGETFTVRPITVQRDRVNRHQSGRRFHSRTATPQGRKLRALPTAAFSELSLIDTLRAALPHQFRRRQHPQNGKRTYEPVVQIEPADWRRAERVHKVGSCVLFAVDASGSMGAKGRILASKGAVLSLLLDAYVRRDQVGLIAFRRRDAELLLPFTHAIERATRELAALPTGGRTPLGIALRRAHTVAGAAMRKDPTLRPLIVLVTDGRANVNLNGQPGQGTRAETLRLARQLGDTSPFSADAGITWVVVDATEPGAVQAGRAKELADALGAQCYSFSSLKREDLLTVTKAALAHIHH